MDWERIESARARARFMLAIPWLVIASLAFIEAFAPHGASPMPIDALTLSIGAFGVLVGFVWMWRIYRAPMTVEGAHWRFHDE